MSNYSNILSVINANVYQNDKGYITGAKMNTVLKSMVATLGQQEGFMGIATPDTTPSEAPDAKQFYLSKGNGDYSAFGGEYSALSKGLFLFSYEAIDEDTYEWVMTDLLEYVSSLISIPTKLSELDNDQGFVDIDTVLNQVYSKGETYTKDEVDAIFEEAKGQDGKDGADGSILFPTMRVDASGYLVCDVPTEAGDSNFEIDSDGYLCVDYPDVE